MGQKQKGTARLFKVPKLWLDLRDRRSGGGRRGKDSVLNVVGLLFGLWRSMSDAVVIPGGGLDAKGQPHPFVIARLAAAVRVEPRARWYIVLSRGTTHCAPPLDKTQRPIDEATVSAAYLTDHGIPPERILKDTWSLDTIGNIYFCAQMLVRPLRKHIETFCEVFCRYHPFIAAHFTSLSLPTNTCKGSTPCSS